MKLNFFLFVIFQWSYVKGSLFDWFNGPSATPATFYPGHEYPAYVPLSPGNDVSYQRRSQMHYPEPTISRLTDAPIYDNADWFSDLRRVFSPVSHSNFKQPKQPNYFHQPSVPQPRGEVCLSHYNEQPAWARSFQEKPWNTHLPWGYTPKIERPWDNGHHTHFPQYYQARPTPPRSSVFVNGMSSGKMQPYQQLSYEFVDKAHKDDTDDLNRRTFYFNKKAQEAESSTLVPGETLSVTERSDDSPVTTEATAADSPKKSRRQTSVESSDSE